MFSPINSECEGGTFGIGGGQIGINVGGLAGGLGRWFQVGSSKRDGPFDGGDGGSGGGG